jgi:indolepyruvate ferredoxin oxidoreductase beta subunit
MSVRTHVVVNSAGVALHTLTVQGQEYPSLEQISDVIGAVTEHVTVVDGMKLAHVAGNARALNVVMLGVLAGLGVLPFDAAALESAIDARSPQRHADTNRQAFQLGVRTVNKTSTTTTNR